MKADQLLRQATGLDLSEADVAQAVRRRMRALNLGQPDAYLALLKGAELERLIDEVVVPESWMFRDPEAFVVARVAVQERLARHPGRQVRVLSVPCAGGEEPYSMAMALADAQIGPESCAIDAVDVSPANLARARAARYGRNAFRGADQSFRERYFRPQGGGFELDGALRRRVRFSQGNLLTWQAPDGPYDVIFCRNLLIYFDEPTVASAIARLAVLLEGDGLLLAGYAEVPAFVRHGFEVVRAPGAFALQKTRQTAAPPAPPPSPLRAPRARPAAARTSAPPRSSPQRPAPTEPPPAPVDLLDAARRAADAGDLASAAEGCRALLAAQPDLPEAHYLLGMATEAADTQGAMQHYRRCIYLQPDHYEALCHLALLCEHGGETAQAAAYRQRAARVYARRAGSTS
jgi:chemotaxis protein methyltransferase WspC